MKLKETIKKLNGSAILTEGQGKAVQAVRVLVRIITAFVFMYCTVKMANKSLESIFKQLLKDNLEDEAPKRLEGRAENPLPGAANSVTSGLEQLLQNGQQEEVPAAAAAPVKKSKRSSKIKKEENPDTTTVESEKGMSKLDRCRKKAAEWVMNELTKALLNASNEAYASAAKNRLHELARETMKHLDELYDGTPTITTSVEVSEMHLENSDCTMFVYTDGILPILGDDTDEEERERNTMAFARDVERMYQAKLVVLWYKAE